MAKVGDRIPKVTLMRATPEGPQPVDSEDYFRGRRVAVFSVPGAFTPTCSARHLPGFIEKANEIKAKGVDAIVVTAVNDVFVMDAWTKQSGCEGKIEYLADGNGEFAKAVDLTVDASGNGLGVRSKRYAMVVEDGVVKTLNVEDSPGKAEVSSAENLLKAL